jgi:hypothetical protein
VLKKRYCALASGGSSRISLDLKLVMSTQANLPNTLKHPSAFLPIAMSLLAVGVVLTHIALFGTARQADGGTAAHLWQLLMAGQLPIIIFFAIRWLPQARTTASASRSGWCIGTAAVCLVGAHSASEEVETRAEDRAKLRVKLTKL